jgi:hypothetical protein
MIMKTFCNLKNKLVVLLILSGLFASCKKMIDIPPSPPNQISQVTIFADSTDIMSAIAGVYLYNNGTTAGFAYRDANMSICTGNSGDDLAITTNAYDAVTPQFYLNTLLSNNSDVASLWTSPYQAMYTVNTCINNLQNTTVISVPLRQQLVGELKVVRALYYFNLVNLFGGVPLVTSTDYNVNGTLARSTVDVIYAQIISDLTDAQSKLKAAYPSSGHARPNLYTADALLAKVYLYRGQWQNAYNAADKVISSGLYSLETDLNKVFLDGSKEAIWQLPANASYYATSEARSYIPTSGYTPTFPVSNFLLNAFEAADKRKQNWLNTSVVLSGATATTYYFPYKYKNIVAASATTEDFMVFRLADLYLVRAEAAAQLGNVGGAATDINIVRTRAGLSPTTAITQADMLNAIMHERQTELCFEWGNRWFDLNRWGVTNKVLTAEKPGWRTSPLLYPIPITEINADPNLTQTSGYQ